jgi:CheY-like chemotaxis protein
MAKLTMNKNHRVLLVEDNPDDIFFIQRMFRKKGLDQCLRILTDGQQAMDYLGASGPFEDRGANPLPELVLLDLQLPYYTGLQILDWLKSRPELSELPVIILSSSTQKSDIETAISLGARSYHVKPSNPEELSGFVDTLREKYLAENRAAARVGV